MISVCVFIFCLFSQLASLERYLQWMNDLVLNTPNVNLS